MTTNQDFLITDMKEFLETIRSEYGDEMIQQIFLCGKNYRSNSESVSYVGAMMILCSTDIKNLMSQDNTSRLGTIRKMVTDDKLNEQKLASFLVLVLIAMEQVRIFRSSIEYQAVQCSAYGANTENKIVLADISQMLAFVREMQLRNDFPEHIFEIVS